MNCCSRQEQDWAFSSFYPTSHLSQVEGWGVWQPDRWRLTKVIRIRKEWLGEPVNELKKEKNLQ